MSIFSKIFGSGGSAIIETIGGLVDNLSLTKEEKQEFKLQMQQKLLESERLAQETYQQELESRTEIIKAEMTQGDVYTKRARPTIIYAGLLFIFIVDVLVPIIGYFVEGNLDAVGLELPNAFWYAWGTVVGIYGVGRSAEKLGFVNKATQLATGSGANKINKKIEAKG